MTDVKAEDLAWWQVRLTHPDHHRKTVFRSISEKRARGFIENRFPRGSEAYLQGPDDGQVYHYEAERQGPMGTDLEAWQPFNPDDYVPVDHGTPPGDNAWSDKEG